MRITDLAMARTETPSNADDLTAHDDMKSLLLLLIYIPGFRTESLSIYTIRRNREVSQIQDKIKERHMCEYLSKRNMMLQRGFA